MSRPTQGERLQRLEEREAALRGRVEALEREVHGHRSPLGHREGLRDRVDKIESADAAAILSSELLARVDRERAEAIQAREEAQRRKWGWRERTLLAAVAVAALVLPIANLALALRGK